MHSLREHPLGAAKDVHLEKINVVKCKHQLQFHLACRDPHIFLLSKTKNSMFALKLSLIWNNPKQKHLDISHFPVADYTSLHSMYNAFLANIGRTHL